MAAIPQTERPPDLGWREIGRGEPDDDAHWTAWTAPMPDGDALYRSLVVADGVAIVSVELQARPRGGNGGAEARTIHRRRCPAPDHGDPAAGGHAGALLDAADEAAAAARWRRSVGASPIAVSKGR